MAKNTPGPWEAIGTGVYAEKLEIIFPAHNTRSADDDEKRANARLMAAAPTLLEVLEHTLEGLRNIAPKHLIKHDCFNWNAHVAGACPCSLCLGKRAIAQARGEAS